MQQEPHDTRNSSSQILPLVLAAFAGATLAIACERPASRAVSEEAAQAVTQPQRAPAPAAAAPAAPAASALPPREALTDPSITARIRGAIASDPAMAGADVAVNTDHGVVTLMGVVKSHEQTAIASAHAQREDGVMRVDNHLAMNSQ